jgi:hypothetical protein
MPRREDFIPHWQEVLRLRDQVDEELREAETVKES